MKIFLDIDGVMVHANPTRKVEFDSDGFYKFNTSAVEALKFLCDNTSSEIILSTSHRFTYLIAEWAAIFAKRDITAKNISRIETPVNFGTSRKTEILNWIETCNFNSNDLIIIDDDKSLNGLPKKLKERLVLTNPYIGLTTDLLNETEIR